MKKYPFLDLKHVNKSLEEDLKKAACDVISSGWYINGQNVELLENSLADLCNTTHAIAVSNGLDALRLILRAYIEMGIMNVGDEIIVPANTYVATVLAISDNQLIPVFAEPSASTMNLDINKIEQHITKHTKGIMPVHLYGSTCWSESITMLAKHYKLKIIEDNAQGIGAISNIAGVNGTFATGGLGDAGALSFYPTKNLGALGDAGAVVTNDKLLYSTIKALRNYGSDYRYHNIYQGFNCRMDEIQAAMLRVKLPYLNQENKRRNILARIYDTMIDNNLIIKPQIMAESSQVWHQYVVRTNNREAFRDYLLENGIETDILYATPPYLQPCYSKYNNTQLPITQMLSKQVISLPISVQTTESDVHDICTIINKFAI